MPIIKPYVTSNPKDPRIQQYNDSASLYNNSIALKTEFKMNNYVPAQTGDHISKKIGEEDNNGSEACRRLPWTEKRANSIIEEIQNKGGEVKKVSNTLYSINDANPEIINKNNKITNLFSTEIKPNGTATYIDTKSNTFGKQDNYIYNTNSIGNYMGNADERSVYDYSNVKPKQQVIYKPKVQPKAEGKVEGKVESIQYIAEPQSNIEQPQVVLPNPKYKSPLGEIKQDTTTGQYYVKNNKGAIKIIGDSIDYKKYIEQKK